MVKRAAVEATPGVQPIARPRAAVGARRTVRWGRLITRVITHALLILICVYAIGPLVWAMTTAFKPDQEIMASLNFLPSKPTLDHFEVVLRRTQYPTWFTNSAIVALSTTFLAIFVGTLAGYAMSRWRFRGRTVYGNALLVIQMFPGVMLAIPLYLILSTYHLIDTLFALLVTYLTFALAFSVWMLKGFFDGIPREIDEAALIDGAGRLQILLNIILPLAGPGITTVAVFAFLLAWNEFFFAYVFLSTSGNYTLSLGMYSFVLQFTAQWGNIMAAGVLTTLPVLVFFFVLQRALTRGLIAGSVKG